MVSAVPHRKASICAPPSDTFFGAAKFVLVTSKSGYSSNREAVITTTSASRARAPKA